jgi:4-amino-4-deoxy-L-arabinose transferase-like glycosyltransferase
MVTKIPGKVRAWFAHPEHKDFRKLILLAACLHVTLAVIIYLIGYFGLMPDTFNKYGIGISFAIDSSSYRVEAERMAELLNGFRIDEWWAHGAQFHVKLYSLPYAVFGRILGFNVLSSEALNLFYYLVILALVFALCKEVFDRRKGLIAMMIVGLWPSFLLHTTQMLRDPLFIAAMLLLFLTLTKWLTREFSVSQGIVAGVTGSVACLFLWLSRGDMWEVTITIVIVGTLFFALRQARTKRLLAGNLMGAVLLLAVALFVPRVIPAYRQQNANLARSQVQTTLVEEAANGSIWSRIPLRIALLRNNFIRKYPRAGSNIDTDVQLLGVKDIALYLPRAVSIGLLAPFPNLWFTPGANVGLKGRVLGGFETLLMYLFIALALWTLWRERKRLAVWLLALIILVGATALGYVVVNISALYRIRYAFWMLIIILGTESLVRHPNFRIAEPALGPPKLRHNRNW